MNDERHKTEALPIVGGVHVALSFYVFSPKLEDELAHCTPEAVQDTLNSKSYPVAGWVGFILCYAAS